MPPSQAGLFFASTKSSRPLSFACAIDITARCFFNLQETFSIIFLQLGLLQVTIIQDFCVLLLHSLVHYLGLFLVICEVLESFGTNSLPQYRQRNFLNALISYHTIFVCYGSPIPGLCIRTMYLLSP